MRYCTFSKDIIIIQLAVTVILELTEMPSAKTKRAKNRFFFFKNADKLCSQKKECRKFHANEIKLEKKLKYEANFYKKGCGVSYDLCNVLCISYAYLCNVYYVIITSCVLCNTYHAMLSII